jgi:hypothetical protein
MSPHSELYTICIIYVATFRADARPVRRPGRPQLPCRWNWPPRCAYSSNIVVIRLADGTGHRGAPPPRQGLFFFYTGPRNRRRIGSALRVNCRCCLMAGANTCWGGEVRGAADLHLALALLPPSVQLILIFFLKLIRMGGDGDGGSEPEWGALLYGAHRGAHGHPLRGSPVGTRPAAWRDWILRRGLPSPTLTPTPGRGSRRVAEATGAERPPPSLTPIPNFLLNWQASGHSTRTPGNGTMPGASPCPEPN